MRLLCRTIDAPDRSEEWSLEETSAQQFYGEAGNWLGRGRAALLRTLLDAHLPKAVDRYRLLEVGAGFGANVDTLARYGSVDVIEVSDYLADLLDEHPRVANLHRTPIPELSLDTTYDVAIAWDVLEHIERDDLAVDWIFDHLEPGGLFIAVVPAYQWLFSDHDRAIHHYRRYSEPELVRLIGRRMHVRHKSYFNTVLFPAAVASRGLWQLRRRLAGTSGQPEKQSSAAGGRLDAWFGQVLEAEARRLGAGARAPFGLSVACVAQRPLSFDGQSSP